MALYDVSLQCAERSRRLLSKTRRGFLAPSKAVLQARIGSEKSSQADLWVTPARATCGIGKGVLNTFRRPLCGSRGGQFLMHTKVCTLSHLVVDNKYMLCLIWCTQGGQYGVETRVFGGEGEMLLSVLLWDFFRAPSGLVYTVASSRLACEYGARCRVVRLVRRGGMM